MRGNAVATFKHHTAPITSVEWNTRDSSVFAASGADDQLTLWDLAVERDDDGEDDTQGKLKDLPPQLLFIHMVLSYFYIIIILISEMFTLPSARGLLHAKIAHGVF